MFLSPAVFAPRMGVYPGVAILLQLAEKEVGRPVFEHKGEKITVPDKAGKKKGQGEPVGRRELRKPVFKNTES